MIKMQTFLRHGDQQVGEYEEVLVSEAKFFEAVDYAAYFGGSECYSKWEMQDKKPECQRPKD
jgi:hypothetical protein